MAIHLLIVEDHPTTRAGLHLYLEQAADLEVVGEAESGKHALELIAKLQPDIVLLDCVLPDISSADVVAMIQGNQISTRVLAFSAYPSQTCVTSMLVAGAQGYVLKSEDPETLVEAIKAIAGGKHWFSPAVMGVVISWGCGSPSGE